MYHGRYRDCQEADGQHGADQQVPPFVSHYIFERVSYQIHKNLLYALWKAPRPAFWIQSIRSNVNPV